MATSETWKGKDGERKEKTEWHRVVLFGQPAEFASEYLKKGQQVYVEGKIQTREWEKDGIKQYTTEVVGERIQGVGGKREGAASSAPDTGSADDPF